MWALFICVFWMAIHRHFPGNMSSFLCLVYLDSAPHISFGGFVGLVWEAVRNLLAVLYVCHSAANLSCLMMKGQTDSLACVRVTFSRPVCHKTATAVERRGGGTSFLYSRLQLSTLDFSLEIDWLSLAAARAKEVTLCPSNKPNFATSFSISERRERCSNRYWSKKRLRVM